VKNPLHPVLPGGVDINDVGCTRNYGFLLGGWLLIFYMQLYKAQNCHCSTSPGVFSRYHIYIFPREE
jgi:hypothetical protein